MAPGRHAMTTYGNLAGSGLRIVGGLIDVVIVLVLFGVAEALFRGVHVGAAILDLAVALGYFGYFWSAHGQTVGMMVFGFRVRDLSTGQYPSIAMAMIRGFIWWLELLLTFCLVGALGWMWMLWDPRHQAIHDKIAGTVVTTS
jgi:uncharacterized RDD family membrane protein YckC